jgi:hypothetical protein
MKKSRPILLQSLLVSFIGVALIMLSRIIQKIPIPNDGEYFYSHFFSDAYTKPVMLVFFLVAGVLGFLLELKPWLIGFLLISFTLIALLYEMIVYPTSHNLLPADILFFLFKSIPPVGGAYIGYLIKRSRVKQTE